MAPLDRSLDQLPEAFVQRMVEVLGSRDELVEVLEAETRPAIRVNALKTTVAEVEDRFSALGIKTERVPFCQASLFYEDPQERGIGNLWEHQAGLVFSQDAASTLPVMALDPQPGERVLDLCAAPGGKTTHMAERMGNRGLIVANDPNPGRVNNMISNLDRVGAMNVATVNKDAARLPWPIAFDRVLVDAPCSNLGGMHEDWGCVYDYSQGRVGSRVGVQRLLLEAAFHAAREGGVIVYSTCTLEPRENEEVLTWFLQRFPVTIEPVDMGVGGPGRPEVAGQRYAPEVEDALRLHPGQAGTDGFFLARLRKEGSTDWEDERSPDWGGTEVEAGPEGAVATVAEGYGLTTDRLDGAHAVQTPSKVYATTVPDLDEALSVSPDRLGLYLARRESEGYRMSFDAATAFGQGAERSHALTAEEAIAWVSGEPAAIQEPIPWSVITCDGEPMGCARSFGDELPCYVPKQRRVPAKRELFGFLGR